MFVSPQQHNTNGSQGLLKVQKDLGFNLKNVPVSSLQLKCMTVAEDQISDYKAHHPRDIIYTITVNHLRTPELPTVNTLFRLDSEGILTEYEYRDNLFLRKILPGSFRLVVCKMDKNPKTTLAQV